MPRLKDLYVVSHTHWDREWYHTEAHFRQRLVLLIDELLDDPPNSFLLDGQAILLDDYLAVRPERAAELSALLRDGRLEAGPWYVLADNQIPSGEALVRNLHLGRETVRLRGESPPVLYCPDSFGHPAILPDLAAGFGCDLVILWRGFGGSRSPVGDVVRWRGASGATVLAYHLPPDGYEFGSSLPTARDASLDRWQRMVETLEPRATTGTALLLNGADHHARQRDHADALRALASAAGNTHVHSTSLRVAARALVDAANDSAIPEVRGELRDSYGYTWTLQGTFGTRASQKRRNAIAERTLVRDVEPWVMLARSGAGATMSSPLLAYAWRTLLQAHPHDTLCGTSIDAVAHAFDARLASVEEQSVGLRSTALNEILDHDVERARANPSEWKPVVVLRNPVARPRGGVVEITLRATLADIAVGPGSASRQGARRRAPVWGVSDMPLQILSREERVELTESPRAYPDADLILEARAVGWTESIAGYTVETRHQHGRSTGAVPHPVVADQRSLDNGRVRIEVDADGRVTFEDREMVRRIDDVIAFERARDAGDLYTPAIREPLPLPRLHRIRATQRGPLRGEIALDYRVAGKSGGSCRVRIQLDANARAMRVLIDGENREHDHRLRLRVSTGLAEATTLADAAFFPARRAPLRISDADAVMEHVVPTAPLHRWIARITQDSSAVLASDGLAEAESCDDGSVAVTLVRAVGELSRADLPERPGHAGWPAPTPDAQCIGPYSARFALQLFPSDAPTVRDDIEHFAEGELLPITGETLRSNLRDPQRAGGLELHGAGLTFSAAAPAQREGWSVLRCVNQRDMSVVGEWRIGFDLSEAVRSRLDETPLGSLEVENGVVRFSAAPKEIVTILVR